MERGPVEVLCLAFPPGVSPERMTDVLRRPVDERFIRLIDLVFLLRNDEGVLEARDVEHEMFRLPELAGISFDPHTLLSAADLETLAVSLPPDQQAVVAVVEHAWARDVTHQLEDLGAELAFYARVPDLDVAAAYAAEEHS
jgi:hypothetical protein